MSRKMGIPHSSTRFLGCKPAEDEDDIHPFPLLPRQKRCRPQISNLGSSIYNAIKRLLQKFRTVFCLTRPRKTSDPLLPIQDPAASNISSRSGESLSVETTLISSPSNDSFAESITECEPTASAFVAGSENDDDDDELQRDNVDVLSSQQWRHEENYKQITDDDVIVSVPDFTCSLAYASASQEMIRSAVFIAEDAARNVPFNAEVNSTENYSSTEEGEEEREEEKVKIKHIIVVGEERWMKHYSSRHRILLVGEGDFSFSACLAVAFGFASNIIATSLDSEAFLTQNYGRAPSNIEKLRSRGSKVMHKIDATEMANHVSLAQLKFDRIIFNFPYAGLNTVKNLPRESQLRRHRRLVSLFLVNAREMISENGEIHISNKINGFHAEFHLESMASSHGLRLIEAVKFNHLDYPGYRSKCGFGGDNFFNCNPSKTYKFGLKGVWH